jgi:deoxyribodipyrimidine photolyase-like uncharacterized protein
MWRRAPAASKNFAKQLRRRGWKLGHHRITNNSFQRGPDEASRTDTLVSSMYGNRIVKPSWTQANNVGADIPATIEHMLSTASYPEPKSTDDTAIPLRDFVYMTKPGEATNDVQRTPNDGRRTTDDERRSTATKAHATPDDPHCAVFSHDRSAELLMATKLRDMTV